MKTKNLKYILAVLLVMMAITSCKKDFLDENPRTDLISPTDFKSLRALLDNDIVMNLTPLLGELSSDNYYTTFQYWQTLTQKHERLSYIWAKDIYNGQLNVDDWSLSYSQVLHANIVLTGLQGIPATGTNRDEWNMLKGSALFYRANAYYNLAQIFAPAYESSTAATDLGLPLRTDPDISISVPRSSVQQTYDSILANLDEAEQLIVSSVQYLSKNRPSQPAVLALKARVYLSMRNYEQAGEYADRALQLYDSLINYNDLNPGYMEIGRASCRERV